MTTLPEIEDKIKHINRVHQEPIDLLSRPMNMEQIIEATEPPKILRLTIKQAHFEMGKTGVMNNFFFKPTNWIKKRILNRKYGFVQLSFSHAAGAPKFTAEYEGYFISESDHFVKFNDSERIEVKKGDYVIKLGRVIKISE